MDDSDSSNSVDSVPSEFSPSQIVEMENIYSEYQYKSLDHQFFQNLASRLSCSSSCTGESDAITCEQVQNWFMEKHESSNLKSTQQLEKPKEEKIWKSCTLLGSEKLKKPKTSNEHPKEEKRNRNVFERIKGLHELEFEARSEKDTAWYDVASFLTYRINHFGETEARVRFSGFGKEEDEWVRVRDGVRERSIPLIPSECHKVKLGDLVLCFQERPNHHLYIDARIARIERNVHDTIECTCKFIVRYDFDQSEEEVCLARICCRPVENDDEIVGADNQNLDEDDKWKLSFLY